MLRLWHLTEGSNTLFVGIEMLHADGFACKIEFGVN